MQALGVKLVGWLCGPSTGRMMPTYMLAFRELALFIKAGDELIVEVPSWSDFRPRTTYTCCVPPNWAACLACVPAPSVHEGELARTRGAQRGALPRPE
jgi:hypothetical protein